MRLLVTLYYWVVFVTTATFGCGLTAVLWLVTWPFDRQHRAVHTFVSTWTFTYLRIWPGWRARVQGGELLPKGPCVIISNHQSMADVVALMGLPGQFKFVSKASLFKLPVIGWIMSMCQYVSVDRGKPHSTHQMVEDCRRWLRTGMPVLIFPEGTYSGGARLLPFKRGAFLLAIEEQVPLVPVVLTGTPELVVEDGPWMSPRASITVRVLPPMTVAELGTDAAALAQRLRERYATELGMPTG